MKHLLEMYIDGFKNMPKWARLLWIIILIKLVVFFGIIRPLFFPRILQTKFQSDSARSEYVIDCITDTVQSSVKP